MAVREFALPDLGEGLTEAEILQWLVGVGDVITLNQPIVEVETAKAAVEVPSPFAGMVVELAHPAGATVDVGSVIIRIEDGTAPDVAATGGGPQREAVLVGYGVKQGAAARRPRRVAPPVPPQGGVLTVPVNHEHATLAARRPLATPPVRKLAKDLGIDLTTITASSPDGIITRAQVQAAASGHAAAAVSRVVSPVTSRPPERIPIKGVRKLSAAAMVRSAFTAPHVTLFMTVDVTETMNLVERLRALPEFAGIKVSPLLLVAKALLLACRHHPEVNASWDEAGQEIVVHGGVNLGIAAATPRGLLVPNIKDADLLSLVELARALVDLAETARAGRTTPGDMTGGTITITNVGVFGVDSGTPILNPGESAILCFGSVRERPWVLDGAVVPRWITQLSMAFDHRLVDGQLGASVLSDVGLALQDPSLLLEGS